MRVQLLDIQLGILVRQVGESYLVYTDSGRYEYWDSAFCTILED